MLCVIINQFCKFWSFFIINATARLICEFLCEARESEIATTTTTTTMRSINFGIPAASVCYKYIFQIYILNLFNFLVCIFHFDEHNARCSFHFFLLVSIRFFFLNSIRYETYCGRRRRRHHGFNICKYAFIHTFIFVYKHSI